MSGRGRAAKSDALVAAAREVLEEIHPATVRGVCYKLLHLGVIGHMAKKNAPDGRPGIGAAYRQVLWARENGVIPWSWVVDEHRGAERAGTWRDPEQFADAALRSFRRDRWESQPAQVEVWSEKGTVRGVLSPVLRDYGVTFRCFHGFDSATEINQIASEYRERPLVALYVGDYDPSGLYMSEVDLPNRLHRYGGDDIQLHRIALNPSQLDGLTSLPAKKTDTRYRWYVDRAETARAWELDALDPRELRDRVERAILARIEPESWERTGLAEQAEQDSLREVLGTWKSILDLDQEYGAGA